MNLTDGDFEFIFNLYDEAQEFIADKDKPEWARRTILHMLDFGFDIKPAYKEISDHCEFLAEAIDSHFEQEEEDEEFEERDNEDDEEYEY